MVCLDDINAGKGTRALLSRHNGLSIGELFTHINKLDFGDKFYIKKEDGEILAYRVYEKTTTTPSAEITERHTEEGYYTDKDNALYTNPEEEILTLQTCTPIYFNTHRLLVNALRIPYEQEEIKIEKDNKLFYAYYLLVALFILNLFRLIFNIVNNVKYNKVKRYLGKTKGEIK